MSEANTIAAPELGDPQRRLRLKGVLPAPSGEELPAELWLTASGLWLVAMADGQPVSRVDVLAASTVKYHTKLLGDRLQVDSHEMGIPTGKGGETQRIIALARLGRSQPLRRPLDEVLAGCPFAGKRGPTERAWLAGWLRDGEQLLAWLDSGSNLTMPSPLLGTSEVDLSFVLTDKRAALVAVGAVGDVAVTLLSAPKLSIEHSLGRGKVTCGEQQWLTTLTNEGDYQQIAPVYAAPVAQRSAEAARVAWLGSGGSGEAAAWAQALLTKRAAREDPWARLALALLFAPHAEVGLLRPLAAQADAASNIVRWVVAWGIADDQQRALVDGFRQVGAAACAGALHQHCWKLAAQREQPPLEAAGRDAALARDLAAAGQSAAAVEVLQGALKRLPAPAAQQLLAHADAAPEKGVLHMRAALLDAIAAVPVASGAVERTSAFCAVNAACAFPLSRARVHAAAETLMGPKRRRAQAWRACLQAGGLGRDELPPRRIVGSWNAEHRAGALRHASLREDGALAALSSMVAALEVVDASDIRAYCEPPAANVATAARAAVARAASALDMPAPELLVAHGERSIGVRAFAGAAPFVIVGDRHTRPPDSVNAPDMSLSATELAFAIGAELALLRWGYARLTSSDAWRALCDDDSASLARVQQSLPALQDHPFAALAAALTAASAEAAASDNVLWPVRPGDAALDPALAQAHASLVLARRAVQLSADRVGLLLAGDIAASVRAILKSTNNDAAALVLEGGRSLAQVLAQRQEDGRLRHAAVALRVGALASLWLGDEYDKLEHALVGAVS